MENSVISIVQKDFCHIPQRGFVKKVGNLRFLGRCFGAIPPPKKKDNFVMYNIKLIFVCFDLEFDMGEMS